jgi:hypothetical protein
MWYMLRWYATGQKSLRLVDPYVERKPFLKGMFRTIGEESAAPQILMSSFGAEPCDWAEYSRVREACPAEIDVVPLPRNDRQAMFHGVSADGKQRLVVMNSTFYPQDETMYRAYLGSSFLSELPRFDFIEPMQGDYDTEVSATYGMVTGQRLKLPLVYDNGFTATLGDTQFSAAGSVPLVFDEGITSLRMRRLRRGLS